MTNEKYQIVVVEDSPKHLEDVRGLIMGREDLVEAVYATNLAEALEQLNSKKFDGVLSDAHFPKITGGPEAPCGIDIIDYAMDRKMPFTIVTSDYHHGEKTESIHQRSGISGMGLIDQCIQGNEQGKTPSKRWGDGLATLVFLIDKSRAGQLNYVVVKAYGSIGMTSNEDGELIRFSLPPFQKNALDKIKQILRL